ncbi:MAG: HPr(Ser) kinase/phosphatase [Gammaproteobacteria bacterium]|nr:HPr(Ser) kinase/phosphatase [Gammaproteobacteria bacterium]
MNKDIPAQKIFEQFQNTLGLSWLSGSSGADRIIRQQDALGAQVNLVSYLNIIHPPLIQVLAEKELTFLDSLGKNSLHDTLTILFDHSAMVIIASDRQLNAQILQQAETKRVPLFSAHSHSEEVISQLRYYLSRHFARQETLHGVFLEVLGMGILISGESGIGKSELALELISRGHRLIADDAPFFTRPTPDILNGSCPKVLSGFLEVRGLGILNIPAMFGENAIKTNKNLTLIIYLQAEAQFEHDANDRIYGSVKDRSILDVSIPQLTLPVASGRNLAVLVEGAVRNHLLRIRGYNAADAFVSQHRQLLDTANK